MKEEHDDKKREKHNSQSPARKVANTDVLNDRIEDQEDTEDAHETHGESDPNDIEIQVKENEYSQPDSEKKNTIDDPEIITIEKNDFENLQDLLVQSGQENENLKLSIKEWMKQSETMSDQIKEAKDSNKDLNKELLETKKVLNTPVLGLAAPKSNIESVFRCFLCEKDDMNQNGIYKHLKQAHKVMREFGILPVEEDDPDKEKRSVVTTVESGKEITTNPEAGASNHTHAAPIKTPTPIWKPYEDLTLEVANEVDECIINTHCEGDCNHQKCLPSSAQKGNIPKVTCNDCKMKFEDKKKYDGSQKRQ